MSHIYNKKGFSLIEVMVALSILGIAILGATSMFRAFNKSDQATKVALSTDTFESYIKIATISKDTFAVSPFAPRIPLSLTGEDISFIANGEPNFLEIDGRVCDPEEKACPIEIKAQVSQDTYELSYEIKSQQNKTIVRSGSIPLPHEWMTLGQTPGSVVQIHNLSSCDSGGYLRGVEFPSGNVRCWEFQTNIGCDAGTYPNGYKFNSETGFIELRCQEVADFKCPENFVPKSIDMAKLANNDDDAVLCEFVGTGNVTPYTVSETEQSFCPKWQDDQLSFQLNESTKKCDATAKSGLAGVSAGSTITDAVVGASFNGGAQ